MKIKPLYLSVFFIALSGVLSGFDTGVISGVLLYIDFEWTLNEFIKGTLVSSVLSGAAIGALLNGKLVDIFGRQKMIFFTSLIFLAGSIFCSISPIPLILILSRFIIGFAIGIITFCAPLYLSEISPPKIRGALVSLFQLAITFGILISYLSNAVFAKLYPNWRLMLFTGVIPAIILAIGVYFLPDTPRWYVLKGKIDKAKETINKFMPDINSDIEIEKIKSVSYKKDKKIKFEKKLLFPLIIGVGGMFIQQFTGINTIIYYAPVILKSAGFSDNLGAICATGGIGIVNFLMTFVAIFYSDKIGRKPLLYIGLSGMGFCLFMLSLSFNLAFNAKYFAFVSSIFYIMFFAISLGPVMILLVSEIFPLKTRGVMMSICMGCNFIFNFIISLLFLPALKVFGEFNIFMFFSVISFLSIIFVRFVIPETKGETLENIERNQLKNV